MDDLSLSMASRRQQMEPSETESESTDSHSFSSTEIPGMTGELGKRVRFFGESPPSSSQTSTPLPSTPFDPGFSSGSGPRPDDGEILVANSTKHIPKSKPKRKKHKQKNPDIGTSVDTDSDDDVDGNPQSDSELESENVPFYTNPGDTQSPDILLNVDSDKIQNNRKDKKPFSIMSILPQRLRPKSKKNSKQNSKSDAIDPQEETPKERELPVDVGNLEDEDDENTQMNPSRKKRSYDAALENSNTNSNSNLQSFQPENNPSSALLPFTSPEKRKSGWKDILITVGIGLAKTVILLFLLYMFVCSLDLLSLGFRLIGGKTAGEIFRQSEILQNPVVGLMIGILTTVLVQSSSTATSIIVGMVAANFLTVQVAIPIIMGSNIGTSITNTLVAVGQAGDREQFRRAFAGATLLDMFNWMAVIVLLPLEITTGYLYHVTCAIMNGIMPDKQSGGDFQLLAVLTKPFVNLIIQLDRKVLECWSSPNCTHLENASLIREFCSVNKVRVDMSQYAVDPMGRAITELNQTSFISETPVKCDFIFAGTPLSDAAAGAIILVSSLIVLCSCLILIVKVLSSVLQGHLATVVQKTLNSDIPHVPWLTGYIAILVGAVITFLVQSSSVFTSAITPLIGLGMISVERAYPLTLGSNIGTTTTALLASMAVEGEAFFPSMQIALCHALFNISGILLFYPIPFLRFPIAMAKFLGKTTSKYRWFALFYMLLMFAVLPMVTVALSFGGPIPVILFCSLILIVLLFILILTLIQRKRPNILPVPLRTWKFLPAPLRSLQPYDDFFTRFNYCQKLAQKKMEQDEKGNSNDHDNDKAKNKIQPQPHSQVVILNNIPQDENGDETGQNFNSNSNPSESRTNNNNNINNNAFSHQFREYEV